VLQALLYVVVYSNLLYFFRAFLSFAVLVHVFLTILVDIIPFMVMLVTMWVGFGFALSLLFLAAAKTSPQFSHYDNELMFPEQGDWSMFGWLYHSLNMGLYGHLDDGTMLLVHESTPIMLFFALYMFVVHLVLLNLLIAIMQFSYSRSIAESQLVAKYRRARLVLEQEGGLSQSGEAYEARHPRWLHVLMPAEEDGESDLFGKSLGSELEQIQSTLERVQARLQSSGCSRHSFGNGFADG